MACFWCIMATMDRVKKRQLFYFLVVLLTSVAPILPYIIKGQGIYTLADDFDTQILPFGIDMVRTMRAAGPDSFSYKIDLGSPTLTGYSYYGLFSPFFAPAYLFPESLFLYVTGVLFIVKYMVACYSAFFFLRRFTKEDTPARIASLMYAFSGYSCVNMVFYFFHDSVALFPVLLYAAEDLMEQQRPVRRSGCFFAFAVFLNCITNYFFFVQEVIFLVIYYLFRSAGKKGHDILARGGVFLLFGTIGVGMAAVAFLPNMIYILDSNRVLSESESLIRGLLHDPAHILVIFKGLLLPGEAMNAHSAVMERDFLIGSVYLPGGGLALVIAYIAKQRTWLGRMLLTLFVLSFSPLLSSVFLLFVSDYYRWWFMPALLMALAAAIVLDDMRSYPVKRAVMACMMTTIAFALVVLILKQEDGSSYVLRPYRLALLLAIALSAEIMVITGKRQWIGICVVFGCVATTFLVQRWYRNEEVFRGTAIVDHYRIAQSLHNEDANSRYQNGSNFLIFPSDETVTGIRCYTTTAAHALREYDGLFGYYQSHGDRRMNKSEIPGLFAALGGRYKVFSEIEDFDWRPVDAIESGEEIATYDINGRDVRIMEYPSSPIAYTTGRFMRKSEFDRLDNEQKGMALLYAVLLDDEVAEQMPGSLQEVSGEDVRREIASDPDHLTGEALFSNEMIAGVSSENRAHALEGFEKDYHGFGGTSHTQETCLLYVSIPGDAGWSATIDGEKTSVLNSGGMMAVLLPEGTHEIVFRYQTPFLAAGITISVISFLIWIGVLYRGISDRNSLFASRLLISICSI